MRYQTVLDVDVAARYLYDDAWVFVDCRFTLAAPDAGREQYLEGHIPGAVYADLERDLSGPVIPGRTGRHPLPGQADLEAVIRRLGIDSGHQVVAYDQRTGALAAARLWWLLRWAGLEDVAVLDGGLDAWTSAGLPIEAGEAHHPATDFSARFRPQLVAEIRDVCEALEHRSANLVDARAASRFRGENETIDLVAGHIPGAISLPYDENLAPDGRFKSRDALRARFDELNLGPAAAIMYCGSGVTAAHNALACVHAGLGMPRVYPGSWSEWITDPARPIERG